MSIKNEIKRLDIPFDTALAEQLELKVDPCAFRTVKSYFRNPNSEISQVVIVQGDHQLHEVAALFVKPPEGREEETLLELLQSDVVRFGVDDMQAVSLAFRRYAVALDTIRDDRLCYVIYLPPFYLVKVTEEKWR